MGFKLNYRFAPIAFMLLNHLLKAQFNHPSLWLAGYQQFNLQKNVMVKSDLQARTNENGWDITQVLFRIGLFKKNKQFNRGIGIAMFNYRAIHTGLYSDIFYTSMNEPRLYQEISIEKTNPKVAVTNVVRLEQRYFISARDSQRWFQIRLRLKQEWEWYTRKFISLLGGYEIMFHEQKRKLSFNQNRIWLGIKTKLAEGVSLNIVPMQLSTFENKRLHPQYVLRLTLQQQF